MKAKYVNKWRESFGVGVPTTIIYQVIDGYEEMNEQELHAHFILEGLNIAIKIKNHCTNHR